MSLPLQTAATPQEFLLVLYRHRWKALLVFLAVLVAASAGAVFYPVKYASETKLFVRLGRENIGLDPTATTGQTVSISESRESEINSVIEILRSRSLAERVVQKVSAEAILQSESASPEQALDKAVQKLQKSITFDAGKKSAVVTIHVESYSPKFAQTLCATMLELYLGDHAKLNSTAGAYEFFEEQSNKAAAEARLAMQALRDVKSASGIVTLDGQRQELQRQHASMQAQVQATATALESSRTKTAELTRLVNQVPERINDDDVAGIPNTGVDLMKQRFYELQLREKELATKFNDNHPQLLAIREQLVEAKKLLDAEPKEHKQTTARASRVRENLEISLKTELANAAGLQTQLDANRAQQRQSLLALQKLNDDEVAVNRLQRDADVAESKYKTYTEKLEQARINRALNAERISNVNVVQQPTLVLKPVSPSPLLLLALGAVLAVFAGLATPMLASYLDRSLRSTEEIERQLALPVLISIPRLSSRTSLAR